jgi:hypothetical protein
LEKLNFNKKTFYFKITLKKNKNKNNIFLKFSYDASFAISAILKLNVGLNFRIKIFFSFLLNFHNRIVALFYYV